MSPIQHISNNQGSNPRNGVHQPQNWQDEGEGFGQLRVVLSTGVSKETSGTLTTRSTWLAWELGRHESMKVDNIKPEEIVSASPFGHSAQNDV